MRENAPAIVLEKHPNGLYRSKFQHDILKFPFENAHPSNYRVMSMILKSTRVILRPWQPTDRDAFAEMHADPEVMRDLGGAFTRTQSDAKFDRYRAAFEQYGFTRWAVEDPGGGFLGYAGVMFSRTDHPLGLHPDIGWRFMQSAWGHGYATEAASVALQDAFFRVGLQEVLSYTSSDNLRSQALMARLGLLRDTSRDFTISSRNEVWHGLVWVARLQQIWSTYPKGCQIPLGSIR